MKIAMFTNTYLPHVGGVARSVKTLEDACRRQGHEVRVIAPEFEGSEDSPDVLRVPAIQHFNGSDFSVQLPVPNIIREYMDNFRPDLIHSHHPFLLGDAALREAWKMRLPIVFTHHTLYERYTHYVPLDSPALKRVAVQLATEYCNLCDRIIAPSESIERLLLERGVTTRILAIPTGVDTGFFAAGNGARFRQQAAIPADAKVIGHVGRLAKEKNLLFIAEAVAVCLKEDPAAVLLLVGDGDVREEMVAYLDNKVGQARVFYAGKQSGQNLADAYAAMDWFVFASQTETQGLVLAEAMAAGKPVVALDGPGVREIMRDGENGLMLAGDATPDEFAAALARLMNEPGLSQRCAEQARQTAEDYSTERCTGRMLECYEELTGNHRRRAAADPQPWDRLLAGIDIEWNLLVGKLSAAAAAVSETPATEARLD
ncbi:MAG: glycosyltransferase [Verrucomicrobiota bacterium]